MEENVPVIQEDSFTIKKFFGLIKRSAKRILIYAIIFAIIGAGIATLVAVLKKGDAAYKGIIDYNYSGIDNGLDPKGNLLDTTRIKSSNVIYNALVAMGNISEERMVELTDILEDDIILEGYVSESMKNAIKADPKLSYFPSRYIISVKSNSKTKFNKHQYNDFLNKLMEQYIAYFKEYYNYGKIITMLINENTLASAGDYIVALKVYEKEVANLQAVIDAMPTSYNLIRNKLQARLDILSMQVDEIYSYILNYNVQKEGAAMTLEDYFQNEINQYTALKTMQEGKATELKNIFTSYKVIYKEITNDNETLSVTVADLKKYNELITSYEAAYSQQLVYEAKLAESSRAKNIVEGRDSASDAEREVLNAKFETLYTSVNSELSAINAELSEYSKQNLLNSGVKISMNSTIESSISYAIPIIIFVLSLLTGVVSAIVVTQVKSTKSNKK